MQWSTSSQGPIPGTPQRARAWNCALIEVLAPGTFQETPEHHFTKQTRNGIWKILFKKYQAVNLQRSFVQISPCCCSYSYKHLQNYCKYTYSLNTAVTTKISHNLICDFLNGVYSQFGLHQKNSLRSLGARVLIKN